MNNLYPVDVNSQILRDFIEELEQTHQAIERLAIHLEQYPDNLETLKEMLGQFSELMFSSIKLDLVPISESLSDTIKALNLLLRFELYPTGMSEFILLVVDRILLMCRDIARQHGIDIRKTQPILIALQCIILAKDPDNIESGISQAIFAIAQEIHEKTDITDNDTEVTLFDDIELFGDDVDAPSLSEVKSVNIFIPNHILNPVLQARSDIYDYLNGHPLQLLADISDAATSHDIPHTRYLLELTLAINKLAGSPIDTQKLMQGVCLHDISLACIPHILNKTDSLTQEEIKIIRRHPADASIIVSLIDDSTTLKELILHHHERVDGTGYPQGLKSNQISDGGKLLAIVDSFHGMTESRPYKKYPRSMLRAIAEINACVDTQFDSQWINHFNHCIRKYWFPILQKERPSSQ